VFKDFHAEDTVISTGLFGATELIGPSEFQGRILGESCATIIDHLLIDFGPHGGRGPRAARHQQTKKGSVTAAVIEQALTRKVAAKLEGGPEAATMTPSNERVAAVNLFARVAAGTNRATYRVTRVGRSEGFDSMP
jgi:hypothetical protein